jgi:hypothetical protein
MPMISKKWKDTTKQEKVVGIIIIAVFTLVGIVAIGADTSNYENTAQQPQTNNQQSSEPTPEAEPEAEPEATFTGKIVSSEPENPATLRFLARVDNTSEVDGRYSCFVNASDSSGTYKGYDYFETEEIVKAKGFGTFVGVLTVTKEGAFFVNNITIECNSQ